MPSQELMQIIGPFLGFIIAGAIMFWIIHEDKQFMKKLEEEKSTTL